ncbi:hypothetical protein [Nocardioides sp.]|uniref:hypothetical protein n=1 Tax=Nocardioides sp. TaxID=35761 RepID=UPI002ED8B53B
MSLSRSHAVRLGVALLALALTALAVPGSPLRPSAADAAGCSRLVTKRVSFESTETTTTYWVKVRTSGEVITTKHTVIRKADLGRARLKLELCKSGGKWSIYDVDASTPHNDLSLTIRGGKVTRIKPASGDTGYAVYLRGVKATRVRLEADRCTASPQKFSDTALKTLKALTAIPWKVKKSWQSWALFAANIAIPDAPPKKYYCGRIGPVVDVRLDLNNGKPRLVWGGSGQEIRNVRDSTQQPCPDAYRSCAEIWDQTVIIKKP